MSSHTFLLWLDPRNNFKRKGIFTLKCHSIPQKSTCHVTLWTSVYINPPFRRKAFMFNTDVLIVTVHICPMWRESHILLMLHTCTCVCLTVICINPVLKLKLAYERSGINKGDSWKYKYLNSGLVCNYYKIWGGLISLGWPYKSGVAL